MSPTAHRERLQKIRQHFVEAVDYWRQRAARADEVLTDTIGRQRVVAQHRASEAEEAESIAALDFALACLDAQQWQPISTLPRDGSGFLVYWTRDINAEPLIDRLANSAEYDDIIDCGEPPASHWMPLPLPPGDQP